MKRKIVFTVAATLGLLVGACGDDGSSEAGADEVGDGDGDNGTGEGDGDGDPTGDGDGDPTGDGDGDPTGDGDGDSGDGDGDSGDGDGDPTGDGDGDGDPTGDGDGDQNCGAPAEHITCDAWPGMATPLQAIGLNCPGDATNSTPTTADSFNSPDNTAWRIAKQYGTSGDWVPSEGESLLVISTGVLPVPNNQGVIVNDGFLQDNGNPDYAQLPAPMSPLRGSNDGVGGTPFMNCDMINDCSDSLYDQWDLGDSEANDLLWFDFSVDVPPDTTGWRMDFVYFSNEFPEFVDTPYNDIFVVWEVSESYVGNICFIDEQPCTVTALDAIADEFSGFDAEGIHPSLAGTGTDGEYDMGGQTTGWVTLEGPASPDENMELTFAVFDMGDTQYDTMVVLDNWRWNCVGCIPNEIDSCGVQPPV